MNIEKKILEKKKLLESIETDEYTWKEEINMRKVYVKCMWDKKIGNMKGTQKEKHRITYF